MRRFGRVVVGEGARGVGIGLSKGGLLVAVETGVVCFLNCNYCFLCRCLHTRHTFVCILEMSVEVLEAFLIVRSEELMGL